MPQPSWNASIVSKAVGRIFGTGANLRQRQSLQLPLNQNWPRHLSFQHAEDAGKLEVVTRLPNGVRVVNDPVPGHFAAVGTYIEAGSRFETPEFIGVSHILDRLAFKSTRAKSADENLLTLERLGGNYMCSSSRETMVYQATCFNSDVEEMTRLIAETVRWPLLTKAEVHDAKQSAAYEISEIWTRPEQILPELAHMAAFRENTLGNPLICPEERLNAIDRPLLTRYRDVFYRPDRITVAFAGVPVEQAVDLANRYYGDMVAPDDASIPSQTAHYTGGLIEIPEEQAAVAPGTASPLTHMIVAFESVPITDPDVYVAATLQFLLGGGGSFSAGGPGKGMYSRLFTHVLNQYAFMESCMAFNNSYSDSGLFGISASCDDRAARHLALVICQEFARLLSPSYRAPISQTEANRAKNLLKASLMYNLESRFILLEDMARQVQTGMHVTAMEMCDRVDRITVDDLYRVAQRIFTGRVANKGNGSGRPTVLVQGDIKGAGDVYSVCDSFGLGK